MIKHRKLRLLALTILFLLTIHLFIFLTVIRKKSTKPLRIPHLSVPKLEVSVDVHNLPASYLTPGLKNQNRYRDCAPFPKLEDLAFSNTLWQVFRTESGKFYLFNAYLDDRSGSFVRIIASFATFKAPGKVFCQLWYKGVAAPDTVQASGFIKLWREEWNQGTINPYLISCPAKNGTPSSVSLVEVPCERARNNLRVRYSKGVMKDFVVCVKGLMYPFQDEGLRLVEWIEMAKIMGADRIEIYNYHVHGNMAKILKHFKEEGILTITPVTIPGVGTNSALVQNKILKKKLINSVMQEVIHINDCLYKNLHTAKYIVVLDLDEMIVPSGGIWSTILPRLDYLNQDASIVARNVYFMPKIGSGLENSSIPFYLKMLQSVYRTNYSKQFTSVKGFHRVSKIISLHNHLSLTCFGQCTYGVMDTDVAVLHHFKDSCRQVPGSCNESDLVKDTMIWRFRDRLVEATTNTLIHLGFMKT